MARCGCASDTCSCTITAGPGVDVTGAGSPTNPYLVSSTLISELGVTVQKDNTTVQAKATVLDVRGAGVTVTASGADEAIITIPGATGGTGDSIPPGTITMYGGVTAPTGWLLCNGTQYLNSAFSNLAAVIGTRFGGDATHFNVPDLRDRFVIGGSVSKALGSAGGAATKAIATANLPPHAHAIPHTHTIGAEYASNADTGGVNLRITDIGNKTGGGGTDITPVTSTASVPDSGNGPGVGTPLDVTPPYMALNYLIKS